jgi:hypothetical protein
MKEKNAVGKMELNTVDLLVDKKERFAVES